MVGLFDHTRHPGAGRAGNRPTSGTPSVGPETEERQVSDSTVREEPELIQLLTPDGEYVPHPDYPFDPDTAQVRDLYRDLVLVRRLDTEAVALQRQGELGLWASLLGQEAAQIGSARALQPQDMAFPSYREHGVAWCRGVQPRDLLAMFPRRHQWRMGPAQTQLPPLHDRHRQPDAARHRVCDGRAAGRGPR